MLRNEFYDLRCRENERKEQEKWFLNFLIFILKVFNFNCSFSLWWSVWWRRKTEGTKGKRKWNESYDFRSVFIRYYCMRVCLVSENRTERTRNFINLWLDDDNIAWVCLVAEKTEERNGNGIYEIFFLEFMIFSYLRPVWLRRELN